MDWAPTARDTVSVSGRAYSASDARVVFDPTLRDPVPAPRYGRETTYQGRLNASWQRVFSEKSSIDVRFSFEHTDHNELFVPLDYNVEALDFEHHWSPLPRHDLVWGLTYRNANYHVTPTRSFNFQKLNWKLDIYAAFAADDITLVRDRLHFILGLHAGHNYFTGMEYQPTGRLAWTATSNLTTWAAVSRAIRTPSIIDRGNNATSFVFDIAPGFPGVFRNVGNPNYRSEPMMAYELGQRVNMGKRLTLDGTAFLYSYQREGAYVFKDPTFILPQDGDPAYLDFRSVFENARYGKSFGAEVSAAWSATRRWKLIGGYSWLRERMHWYPGYFDYSLGKDPSQQFQIRSQLDLPHNLEFDTTAYFYGSTLPFGVGRYLRGDARLGWKPTETAEFHVGVRNVLDPQHPEQFSIRFYQAFQVRRNVYGAFSWQF
jgi:iron complex outermembrane receptor protein